MSCPMPEIGSCISLISKADIRYEGLLFTVDPDRCTIALARVKSYGTEDRETQFPIAPQNQCYDYILFRGSDIKDIRVINNNPVPNDPAIMQMHLPPQQQLPPMPNKIGQPGFQPQQGFMLPQMSGPGPMGGPPPGHQPMGQPYSSFGGINNLGESVLELIGGGAGASGGSRSTTPSNNLLSRKSPTVDMGVQTNQQQQQAQQQNNSRDGNRSGGDGAGGNLDRANNQRNRNNNQRNNNQRERRDSGKNDGQMKENFNKNMQRQGGGNNQNRGWNNRGNNQHNQHNSNNMRGRPRGYGGPPQGANNSYRRKSATSSDNNKHSSSNGNSTNKKHNNQKQGGNRAKNLLKFENDYDFEQANSKFEELRSQLSKLKVGEDVKPEQLNSETIDKKDDSGNETGAGEHEQEEDDVVCYDKTKSFFDNISCEAIERAKGKQQRTDRRQERKLNTETFGVASTRRGGYNRRGGYYNRGPNNYRGMNQYRGGNNYRGRSNNRNNQHNGLPHNGRNHNNQQQQQPPQAQQPPQPQQPQQPQQQQQNQPSQPQQSQSPTQKLLVNSWA